METYTLKELKDVIELTVQEYGAGNISSSNLSLFRGINHRGVGNPVPVARDQSGLIFFTRPELNLTYNNLLQERLFSHLLTSNPLTFARAVRCLLDPRLMKGINKIDCPLIDPLNPFMPILTNTLMSVSGWPDPAPAVEVSSEGIAKESVSMMDGRYSTYQNFTLSTTFKNTDGNPILAILDTWIKYACAVRLGRLTPYPDKIVEREVDYNSRIIHFILDPTRRYITQWVNCGAMFPNAISLAKLFNFNAEQHFVSGNDTIDIPWQVNGAEYNDPIALLEFNMLIAKFNPYMKKLKIERTQDGYVYLPPPELIQIPDADLVHCNYFGYPYINLETNELVWFMLKEDYALLKYSNTDYLRNIDSFKGRV